MASLPQNAASEPIAPACVPPSVQTRVELNRWDNGKSLWSGEAAGISDALVQAVAAGALLEFVDLTGADLEGDDLPARTDLQNACLKKARFSKGRLQQVNFLHAILDDGSIVIAPYANVHFKADVVAFSTNRGVRYKSREFFGEKFGLRKKLERDHSDDGDFEKQCQWIEACENQGRINRTELAVKAIAENGATFNFEEPSRSAERTGGDFLLAAEISLDQTTFACCAGQIRRDEQTGPDGEMGVHFTPVVNDEFGRVLQYFALDQTHAESTNAVQEAVLKACQSAWDQLDRARCTPLQAALCSTDEVRKSISRAVRAGRWSDYLFWIEVAASRQEGKPRPSQGAWELKIETDGSFFVSSNGTTVCQYKNDNPDDTDWIANAVLLHSSPRVLQQLEYLLDQYIEAVHLLNALQQTPLNQQQLETMSETQQILAHARGEIR